MLQLYYEDIFFFNGAGSCFSFSVFIYLFFCPGGRLQAYAVYLRSYTNNDFVSVIINGDPLRWIFSYTSHYYCRDTRFPYINTAGVFHLAVGVLRNDRAGLFFLFTFLIFFFFIWLYIFDVRCPVRQSTRYSVWKYVSITPGQRHIVLL